MTTAWEKQIDRLMADYQRHRTNALEVEQQLRTISASATSAKGLMTADVGPGGEVRRIVFHSRRYRTMAPAELAHVITETIEQARRNLLQQIVEVMPPVPLAGMTYEDVLNGRVDIEAILPEDISANAFPFLSALIAEEQPVGPPHKIEVADGRQS